MHGVGKGHVAAERRVDAAGVAAEMAGAEAAAVKEPDVALEQRDA